MRFDVLELPDSKVLRVLMNNTYQGVEETVCKFFDTRSDDFFHPDILQCLIKKLKLLPKRKLTPPYTQDVRLYTLTYTFVKANGRHQHKLKAFVGVIQQLSEMHSAGFVHGDIRLVSWKWR